mgnify:CR=1 FL=1
MLESAVLSETEDVSSKAVELVSLSATEEVSSDAVELSEADESLSAAELESEAFFEAT